MLTKLPTEITNIERAKSFLSDLHNNGEAYHPEDDAHDIVWHVKPEHCPTPEECDQLNKLMDQIYQLDGFDACEYLLSLHDNI